MKNVLYLKRAYERENMNIHLGYVLAMSLILKTELHGLRVLQSLFSALTLHLLTIAQWNSLN